MAASPVLPSPLRVAVTLSDVLPIVQAVGGSTVQAVCVAPPGGDPHGFAVTVATMEALGAADLIVCTGSHFLEFERQIREAMPRARYLDWPDYVAQGAQLRDVPGIPANPHGFWLGLDNARAIARAVAAKLKGLGAQAALVDENLARFTAEVAAARETGLALARATGAAGQTLVAVVPGVTDCILNLDMKVGMVLLPTEGASFASGQDVNTAVAKLSSGEWAGLICPLGMEQSKPGEIARQIAQDAGSRVVFVRFLSPVSEHSSFLAQAYYNAALLTSLGSRTRPAVPAAAGGQAPQLGGDAHRRESRVTLLVIVVLEAAIIVALIVALRRVYRAQCVVIPGAGIFGEEGDHPD